MTEDNLLRTRADVDAVMGRARLDQHGDTACWSAPGVLVTLRPDPFALVVETRGADGHGWSATYGYETPAVEVLDHVRRARGRDVVAPELRDVSGWRAALVAELRRDGGGADRLSIPDIVSWLDGLPLAGARPSDPRGDGLCPACPTDLAWSETGHGVCVECGWTSDPSALPGALHRLAQRVQAGDDLAEAAGRVRLVNGALVGIDDLTDAAERWRATQ